MLKDIRIVEKEKGVETVRLQIDRQSVEAPKGMNIVEAAKRIGIDIPVFCYHPQLSVVAACRMCLVEIEGRPKLTTACSTEVEEGISVLTASPAARDGQRSTLEFLLINHPLDCPVCDKGGECPLQDLTYDFGPGKSRFNEPKWHFKKPIEIGPHILLDRERCIMCMRCTRYCDEIAWHPQLILAGTTTGIQIATAGGLPFNSQFSGNTVEICPVGALLNKQYYLQARPWEIDPTDSICSLCSVGCNITVHTREERIKRVISRGQLPRKNPGVVERFTEADVKLNGPRIKSTPLEMYQRGHPDIDDGWLCDKGRFGFTYVHEGRLETPLEKVGEAFVPVSWEYAIRTIAQRLNEAKLWGGHRIAAIGSPKVSNEAAYLFQKFFRAAIGTNHIDHHPHSEWGAVEKELGAIWNDQFLRFAIRDLDDADTLFVLGSNVSEEVPVIELRIKKSLRLFHSRLVMAYPWEVELSGHADPWLRYAPGHALSLIRALLTRMNGNEEEMRAHAKEAGVSSDDVAEMAAAYQGARRLVILLGPEITHGPDLVPFLGELKRLISLRRGTEQWTSVGVLQDECNSQGAADMGLSPDFLPGYQPVQDTAARNRLEQLWGANLPARNGMTARQILETFIDGENNDGLQALYLMGTNLVVDKELGGISVDAISKVPFVVVQDLSFTETARLAQIVLPMGSWAESDGTYTNTDRHIQRFRKVIPFAGESRPDWKIFEDLGKHFGPGRQDAPVEEIWDEIAQAAPMVRSRLSGDLIDPEGQWGR
jgi:NADH-quinone oxidoreductase subunit G